MNNNTLFDKLKEYSNSDFLPLHMPGHKRKPLTDVLKDVGYLDITEISGFDNLGNPEGILKDMQDDLASYCGVKNSYFLVDGSTVGILTAISAAVPKGGKLLIARNSHKSTYHGIYLREIEPVYMYPEIIEGFNCFEAVTPEIVAKSLNDNPGIDAVLVVSPTYEGRIADIESIAEIVHRYNIPLIVDEAHGAHLNYSFVSNGVKMEPLDGFALSACRLGADIAVQSFHKTLPSLTQTAVLQFNSSVIDRSLVDRFLHIYQTSSPSYPMMAGIEQAHIYMKNNAHDRLQYMYKKYTELVDAVNGNCKYIYILSYKKGRQDTGKLLISCKGNILTGKKIADLLRDDYHIETEMSVREYCLGMFTVADEDDAYSRTAEALTDIDRKLCGGILNDNILAENIPADSIPDDANRTDKNINVICEESVPDIYKCNKSVIPLGKAWDMKSNDVLLANSEGLISGGFIGLYPPGTPILVPGELIETRHIADIEEYISMGYEVTGIKDGQVKCIDIG